MQKNNEEQLNQPSSLAQEPSLNNKNPLLRATNKGYIGLLILVLFSFLLTASSFYQNWHLKKMQHQQQFYVKRQINSLKKEINATTTTISTAAQKIQESQNALNSRVNQLDNNLQSALQQRFFQNQDWLLLKARYYLELVQLHAHWGEDQQITVNLLQQADQVLQQVDEQQLFAVRQAIAQEIIKLKATPTIDVAGILSRLDAAQTLVQQLPIQENLLNNEQLNSTFPANTTNWREKLTNSLSYLKKLVIVRRHEGEVQPIYSPLRQSLLREAVRMQLQEAQWAVLQKNRQVYSQALTQATTTIKNTFDIKATNTQSLLKQLQELQQQKLVYAKPIVDQPLQLLNDYIMSKNQPNPTGPTPAGDKS